MRRRFVHVLTVYHRQATHVLNSLRFYRLDYGTLDYYSASNCDPNYWIGAGTVYLGCTVESMTLGDDDAAVADSQSFMCSNNKDTLYPVYGGAFAMNRCVALFISFLQQMNCGFSLFCF